MTIKVKVRGHNGYDIDDLLINTDKKNGVRCVFFKLLSLY